MKPVWSQKWSDNIDGSGTDWGNLPTKMEFEFTNDSRAAQLVVFAHFSRVQHNTEKVNTEFRILVNDEEIAIANTGNAYSWDYRDISFHGTRDVRPGEHLHVEVQYRTQKGTVIWSHSSHGPQQRVLTAILFPTPA